MSKSKYEGEKYYEGGWNQPPSGVSIYKKFQVIKKILNLFIKTMHLYKEDNRETGKPEIAVQKIHRMRGDWGYGLKFVQRRRF